ncbi:MAG: DUF222 domain-containing protein, partial [Actinomycetota bacterium]
VVALEAAASTLEAARLRLLAEADRRDVGAPSGAASTADWFAHATNTRPERAGARVALAAALDGPLAATGRQLAAGAITVEHAQVVHRTIDRLAPGVDGATRAEAEAFLLEHAERLDPRRLARLGHRLRTRLDPGADDQLARDEDAQTRANAVAISQDDDGTWWLSGTLDPVAGQSVHDALAAHAAPRPALDGVPDPRPARQRLADALVHLCERALAGGGDGQPACRPRPRLVVSTTLPALLAAPGVPGLDGGALSCGHPVSLDTVRMLACDGEIVPVLIDGAGRPLDVGQTVYTFPPRIRTAIIERDRGCTFGGCTRPPSWCDLHHLTSYAAGGPTSERNGCCLCPFHHRLVHRQGWRGELVGTRVVWHPPDGRPPHVPPPPWQPALDRLVTRSLERNPHLQVGVDSS